MRVYQQMTTGVLHRRRECGVTARTRYSHVEREMTHGQIAEHKTCARCFCPEEMTGAMRERREEQIKLSHVDYAWYASADGKWAVVGDGADAKVSKAAADGDGVGAGLNTSSEWQVLYSPDGSLRTQREHAEMIQWVGTLREGREVVNREARKEMYR